MAFCRADSRIVKERKRTLGVLHMKPVISVIIPCYNVAQYLPECMASLEKQTIGMEKLQLVFVDDASTDGLKTWKCILDFEKKYPEQVVAVQLEENRGQGGARNEGLKYASADYIGYIDADDYIEAEMYEKLYQAMLEKDYDIVDCRMVMDMPNGVQYVHKKAEDKEEIVAYSIMEGGHQWIGKFLDSQYGGGIVTGIYRKSLIVENKIAFPEHLRYEDNYWQSILLCYVKSIYHLADSFYHYRQHASSTVHKRNEWHHLDRLEIELRKLEMYDRLHITERFHDEVEWEFLSMYYCNTLYTLWTRFDEAPYDVFCEMTAQVKKRFPHYKKNPYMREGELESIVIGLVDRDLSEEQFRAVGQIMLTYANEGQA